MKILSIISLLAIIKDSDSSWLYIILGIVAVIFWIRMVFDSYKKGASFLWVMFVSFFGPLGALIYFIFKRPKL